MNGYDTLIGSLVLFGIQGFDLGRKEIHYFLPLIYQFGIPNVHFLDMPAHK